MNRLRTQIVTIIALAILATATLAQAQTQPQSPTKPATASTKVEDVSKWTQKQWNAAKAKWSKEKTKWSGCQKQASEQKLSGRKSWKFLYDCMTK